MKEVSRGIVHNAFYKQNRCDDTKEMLWGRSQNALMEVFKYGRSEDGKITITKRKN